MRIGTVLVLLVVSWIALGYLLSNNINMYGKLKQIQQQNQQLAQDILALQAELEVANNNLTAREQKVTELTQQNIVQQDQIRLLTEENKNLRDQNNVLQRQTKVFELFNRLRSSFSRLLGLVFLLPAIPASMTARNIMICYTKNRNQWHTIKKQGQCGTYVQLTKHEVNKIVRMRRS